MVTHPQALLALGDAGAHVGTVCDASLSTTLLAHWTRDLPADGKRFVQRGVAMWRRSRMVKWSVQRVTLRRRDRGAGRRRFDGHIGPKPLSPNVLRPVVFPPVSSSSTLFDHAEY